MQEITMYISFLYLLLTSCIQEKYSEHTMPEFDYAQEGQGVGDIVFKTRFLNSTHIRWLPDNGLLFHSGTDDITPEGRKNSKLEIWYPDTNKRLVIEKPYDLFSEEQTNDTIHHMTHDVRFCDTKPFNNIIETYFYTRTMKGGYKEHNNTYRYYQYDPKKRSIKKIDLPDYYHKLECSDSYYKQAYGMKNLLKHKQVKIPKSLKKYQDYEKYGVVFDPHEDNYFINEKEPSRKLIKYNTLGNKLGTWKDRIDSEYPEGWYSPYAQSYVATAYNKNTGCMHYDEYLYNPIDHTYDKRFLCFRVNGKNTYFTDMKNHFLQYQDGLVGTTYQTDLDRRQRRQITQISTINFNGDLNRHILKSGFRLDKTVNVSPDGCHIALTGNKTLIIYKLCEPNNSFSDKNPQKST